MSHEVAFQLKMSDYFNLRYISDLDAQGQALLWTRMLGLDHTLVCLIFGGES